MTIDLAVNLLYVVGVRAVPRGLGALDAEVTGPAGIEPATRRLEGDRSIH